MGIKISNTDIADIKIGGVSALRVMRGGVVAWTGGLQILSVSVDASGGIVEVAFSTLFHLGADGADGLVLHGRWGDVALTYNSGEGTTVGVFAPTRPLEGDDGDPIDWTYAPPGDGLLNSSGVEMLADTGAAPSESEYYGGATVTSWHGDYNSSPRRLRLTWSAELITKSIASNSTNNSYRVPLLVTESMVAPDVWRYLQNDGADLRIRSTNSTVAIAHWRLRVDPANDKFSLFVIPPSLTSGIAYSCLMYFGDATLTTLESESGTLVEGMAFFGTTALQGSGYLAGSSVLPLDLRGGGTVAVAATPHELADGIHLTTAQALYIPSSKTWFMGGSGGDQMFFVRFRLPAAPASAATYFGLTVATSNVRGNLKDIGFRDNAGALEMFLHLGDTRAIYYSVAPEHWGQLRTLYVVARDVSYSSPSCAVVDSGYRLYLDTELLESSSYSAATDLLTFARHMGGRFVFGGSGYDPSNANSYSPPSGGGARGDLEMSYFGAMQSVPAADATFVEMLHNILNGAATYGSAQLEVSTATALGVVMSATAQPGERHTFEAWSDDGSEKYATPFADMKALSPDSTIARSWGAITDIGVEIPDGDFTFRKIKAEVNPVFLGPIGNTSYDPAKYQSSTRRQLGYWRSLLPHADLVFAGGRFYCLPGHNEGQPMILHGSAADLNYPYLGTDDNRQYSQYQACADATHLFCLSGWDNYNTPRVRSNRILKYLQTSGPGLLTQVADVSIGAASEPDEPLLLDSGIAVVGSYIVVTSRHRGAANIRVFDKSDLSFEFAVDPGGAAWRCDILADSSGVALVIEDGAGWRIATLTGIGTTNTITWVTSALSSLPLDLSVDPASGHIGIFTGNRTCQVHCYDLAGSLQWTLGQLGGVKDNGGAEAPDKWDDVAYRTDAVGSASIVFDEDGELLVWDSGNKRYVRFAAYDATVPREYLAEYHPGLATYNVEVDPGDPTKWYVEHLVYEVTYSTDGAPLSWALIHNLRYNPRWEDGEEPYPYFVRTVERDGVTKTLYLALWNSGNFATGLRVYLLDTDTFELTDTGLTLNRNGHFALTRDGDYVWIDIDQTSYEARYVKQLTGWHESTGFPVWQSSWTETCRWPIDENWQPEIGRHGQETNLGFAGYTSGRYDLTANGTFPVYCPHRNNSSSFHKYHLAFVAPGATEPWAYAFGPGGFQQDFTFASANHPDWGLITNANSLACRFPDFIDPSNGAFGSRQVTCGPWIVTGFLGEKMLGGQVCVFWLWHESGSFVCRFGLNNRGGAANDYPRPHVTGNAFALNLVEVDGEYYLIAGCEGVWSGPVCWHIQGLDTISISETTLTKG